MIKQVVFFFIHLNFFESFCDAFTTALNQRSRHLQQSTIFLKWSPSRPIIRQQNTPIMIYSTPGDDTEGARHTYVEGGEYDDIFSEIEAMGGDPFFLDDEESEVKMAKKEAVVMPEKLDSAASIMKAVERSVTDGKGPSPREKDVNPNESKSDPDWEWDGTIDEEAHLGWD